MIQISLRLSPEGEVIELKAEGHAEKRKGFSFPCGLVSYLTRTFLRSLASREGIDVTGTARQPGELYCEVRFVPDEDVSWYRGAGDMLIKGLKDISAEYPGDVRLTISVASKEK